MKQRIMVKGAHRPRTEQWLTHVHAVQQVPGNEATHCALDRQIVVLALHRRGGNRIRSRRVHAVDFDEQVDVLPGLERRQQLAIDGAQAQGPGARRLVDDLHHFQRQALGVQLDHGAGNLAAHFVEIRTAVLQRPLGRERLGVSGDQVQWTLFRHAPPHWFSVA